MFKCFYELSYYVVSSYIYYLWEHGLSWYVVSSYIYAYIYVYTRKPLNVFRSAISILYFNDTTYMYIHRTPIPNDIYIIYTTYEYIYEGGGGWRDSSIVTFLQMNRTDESNWIEYRL